MGKDDPKLYFEKNQPEIVCVELDKQRYKALMIKRNDPESYKKMERKRPQT